MNEFYGNDTSVKPLKSIYMYQKEERRHEESNDLLNNMQAINSRPASGARAVLPL